MVDDEFCPACGAARQAGMHFCGKCGHDFGLTPGPADGALPGAAGPDAGAAIPGWGPPVSASATTMTGVGIGGAVAAVGGVALVVGTALPWITATAAFVGTMSRSGLEMGGDPMVVAGAGGLIAVVGTLVAVRGRGTLAERLIPAILGAGAAVMLVIDYQDLARRVSAATDAFSSGGNTSGVAGIGVGFWVCVIGVVLAVASAILPTRESATA